MNPSVGRIIHFVLPRGRSAGEVRAALIVKVWNPTCVNLQVFLDGSNDAGMVSGTDEALTAWQTSVLLGDASQPGTWFWPPKV